MIMGGDQHLLPADQVQIDLCRAGENGHTFVYGFANGPDKLGAVKLPASLVMSNSWNEDSRDFGRLHQSR